MTRIHHLHGSGAGHPEDRDEGRAAGSPHTRTGTSTPGLAAGLAGRAQIGKGMWAAPDAMADMMEQKDWPSPRRRQYRVGPLPHGRHPARGALSPRERRTTPEGDRPTRAGGLSATSSRSRSSQAGTFSPEEIANELDNNVQGILGYVVRWVGQGVGCSKVPDINDVALMEDRATLRISSQHIANWLRHGVIDEAQVRAAFERMAPVVDRQNAGDPSYRAMSPGTGREHGVPGRTRSRVHGTRAAERIHRVDPPPPQA